MVLHKDTHKMAQNKDQLIPEKWAQFFPPNLEGPNAVDDFLEKALAIFTERHVKQESARELGRKERVLLELQTIFNTWVRACAKAAGVEEVTPSSQTKGAPHVALVSM